jgi:hypothetical protein
MRRNPIMGRWAGIRRLRISGRAMSHGAGRGWADTPLECEATGKNGMHQPCKAALRS